MIEKPAVRIKDIAKESGVSPATVSLVLNNKGGVGDDTRNRILSIAKEMGYNGPALKTKEVQRIGTICFLHITCHGHILNRDHDVFISDYIEGLSKETQSQKYNLLTVTFKSAPINDIITFINQSDADGFIVLATELSRTDILTFGSVSKPFVFLDAYYPYLNMNFVDMNNADIIYNALTYLKDCGHKEIGFISGLPETPNFQLRENAFRNILPELGLTLKEKWMIRIDSLFEQGYKDFSSQIPKTDKFPTAFLCGNDILAASSMKALKESGYKIPDDISILGIDDLPLSGKTNPSLSSFKVSKVRLGINAVQILIANILENNCLPSSKILISGELVVRDSIKKL